MFFFANCGFLNPKRFGISGAAVPFRGQPKEFEFKNTKIYKGQIGHLKLLLFYTLRVTKSTCDWSLAGFVVVFCFFNFFEGYKKIHFNHPWCPNPGVIGHSYVFFFGC